MNIIYQERYQAKTWEEIVTRISSTIEMSPAMKEILTSQTFVPAGNTLMAGKNDIYPNCCVLGTLTDLNFKDMLELSKKLWKKYTGIGYDLSSLTDPVKALLILSEENHKIDLHHRPKRGNMAVLNITHPKLTDFIQCKEKHNIYNFNISVSVSNPDELSEPLLKKIAQHSHKTGDPGLVFLDHAQNYGPVHTDTLEPITTCVPCGEQFMHAFETCNLGSINLNSKYLEGDVFINYSNLEEVVREAVEFLDNVIDHLKFPSNEIQDVSLKARRIGLGVMGWADLLHRKNISYNNPLALQKATEISKFITKCAEKRSRELAVEKGPCAYSHEYRNISLTCIAPTGGITGVVNNKGYAIEPMFEEALNYTYKEHIDMQAAWQYNFHNAVSKTVNLPNEASVQDIINTYQYAIAKGVKGITVYRDASKTNQPQVMICKECV